MTDTLLICASFFGYAREMQRSLEQRGRSVVLFEDTPATGSITKAMVRVAPALMRGRADAYFEAIIAQLRDQPIRDVLVIKGEALSLRAIQRLRAAFPRARFTLYFWDSYRNMPPDSRDKVALFDRAFSFDPHDAAHDARLIYRPLFFVERFAQLPVVPQDIEALFFGTIHGDRYAVLRRIAGALPQQLRFEKVLYFRASWLYTLNKLANPNLWRARRSEFIFKPKSRDELALLTARSRIVIDIERPVQTGFTIRTIEMLAAGRKLITTNAEVANADFYDPANIAVIDRRAPHISPEFLVAPFRPVAPEIVNRYSLDGWLDDVLPAVT